MGTRMGDRDLDFLASFIATTEGKSANGDQARPSREATEEKRDKKQGLEAKGNILRGLSEKLRDRTAAPAPRGKRLIPSLTFLCP